MNRVLRNRLATAGLLIVTFLTGALAGAAGDRLLHADEPRGRERGTRGGRQDMTRMFEELDLTAEQRAEVERVLEARRPRVEAVWDSLKPRLRAQIDSTNAEIRVLLTTEQRATFDRLIAEREARFRDRHRQSGGMR